MCDEGKVEVVTATERLQLLYEVNRRLSGFTDLNELVHYGTRRTRELFEAEGCAILLVDPHRKEFFFPVASQSAFSQASPAHLAEIRFPADRGVAGWVMRHNQATLVPDTAADPRFYGGVDRQTHIVTRSLLCAPLRTPSGNIGVIEVVNPAPSCLTNDDIEFLDALAVDIAVAHEKALLYERLRGEVVGLRQACGMAGYGLLALGLALAIGTAFSQLALALPAAELLTRPTLLAAVGSLLVGGSLLAVARGWIVRRIASA